MQVACRCGQPFTINAGPFPRPIKCHSCGHRFNVLDTGEVVELSEPHHESGAAIASTHIQSASPSAITAFPSAEGSERGDSSASSPDWAVRYVRDAMQLGKSMREMEDYLVSLGMTREAASVLILDLKYGAASGGYSEGGKFVPMFLSALIAATSLTLAYWTGGGLSLGRALISVIPEVFLIWYCEWTETGGSSWGKPLWWTSWAMLVIYLGYRAYWFLLIVVL